MNEPQDDLAVIAELRADLREPAPAVRARLSGRLASSVGALILSQTVAAPIRPSIRSPLQLAQSAWQAHASGFALSFALGGVIGAGAYAALKPSPPSRIVYVDRPVSSRPSPARSAETPASPPPPVVMPPTPPPRPVSAPRASSKRPESASLSEQQALLDIARSDFARGDFAATLAALSAHSQRFSQSVLDEEREALAIKALAASGRRSEAEERAARFASRFPQSLLLSSVNDSLRAIP